MATVNKYLVLLCLSTALNSIVKAEQVSTASLSDAEIAGLKLGMNINEVRSEAFKGTPEASSWKKTLRINAPVPSEFLNNRKNRNVRGSKQTCEANAAGKDLKKYTANAEGKKEYLGRASITAYASPYSSEVFQIVETQDLKIKAADSKPIMDKYITKYGSPTHLNGGAPRFYGCWGDCHKNWWNLAPSDLRLTSWMFTGPYQLIKDGITLEVVVLTNGRDLTIHRRLTNHAKFFDSFVVPCKTENTQKDKKNDEKLDKAINDIIQ